MREYKKTSGFGESLKVNRQEVFNETDLKFKTYEKGLQVPNSLDTQISQESLVRRIAKIFGRGTERLGPTKRKQGVGRASHALPCAYAFINPPKYAVAQVVGFIKGKSAIYMARNFGNRRKNLTGEKFWARGYFVPTCGKSPYVELVSKRFSLFKVKEG